MSIGGNEVTDLGSIDISVIVPFYKGNKYMGQLFECIRNNARNAPNITIELVLVNDSPQFEIEYNNEWIQNFNLIIIHNSANEGIHQSRVNGLNVSVGKYIIFLDQDDLLTDEAIKSQYSMIEDNDIVVSNGFDQSISNYGCIYHSMKHQLMVMEERIYYSMGNMIVSPGQCIIRKNAIPLSWCENIVSKNGSDDLLLWLLLLHSDCRWVMNYDKIYTHVDTGVNVSADLDKMVDSSFEVLYFLKEFNIITSKYEKLFVRRFKMRRFYETRSRWRKVIAFIFYPDIAIDLLRLKTR